MVNKRLFRISDKTFSHYEMLVDLDNVQSLDEIIQFVIDELKQILVDLNLIILKDELEKKKFHIHDFQFGDILISEPTAVFYICAHC